MSQMLLISLAVTPSVTWGRADVGRANMQKMVTPSVTQSMSSKTDGHNGVITVAFHCGESIVN